MYALCIYIFSSFISTLEENALNENEAEEGLFHTWALC